VDKGKGPPSKRQKTKRSKYISPDELKNRMDQIKAIGSSAGPSMELDKERMRQIARREQVLEVRESSWTARWLDQERQLEEKLKKRSDEHEAELKKRTQEAEARIKQQRDELEEEKKELKAMQKDLQDAQKQFFAQYIRKIN